mmetsp:Transcript_38304/g.114694  ORF Transcript_38304/g.114694 Transcript_38304/m.114694 type:complete len:249 (+) Transcript_38304:60-806(+)
MGRVGARRSRGRRWRRGKRPAGVGAACRGRLCGGRRNAPAVGRAARRGQLVRRDALSGAAEAVQRAGQGCPDGAPRRAARAAARAHLSPLAGAGGRHARGLRRPDGKRRARRAGRPRSSAPPVPRAAPLGGRLAAAARLPPLRPRLPRQDHAAARACLSDGQRGARTPRLRAPRPVLRDVLHSPLGRALRRDDLRRRGRREGAAARADPSQLCRRRLAAARQTPPRRRRRAAAPRRRRRRRQRRRRRR